MPDPPPEHPAQPADPTRRKLLLVGGFAAANVVLLRGLPRGGEPGSDQVRLEVTGERIPPGPPAIDGADPPPPPGHTFTLVISGGRVIDPASGFDAVADVGIDSDRIRSISTEPLVGTKVLDATGLVVAPGFIDVLSYEPNPYGVWNKVADGVTTNLGMHGINNTAKGFFEFYGSDSQRPPVHYGGAFDNPHMRDVEAKLPTKAATPAQIQLLERALAEGFADGWIGLDVEPEYTPWVTTEEIAALAGVAAQHGMPVFSHIRYSWPGTAQEGSLAAIDELLAVAERTGAAVHVDHITSMTTHVMEEALARLDEARSRGVDVSACVYPYDFWATTLASARFADGWQERFRISYSDLELPGTGERLTEDSFRRYRAENKLVAAHAIPESDLRLALETPWVMIGSDAILEEGDNNHPRCSGTFSRTLGRYVRDEGVLSLTDALAKMTILPARRLEARVPAMRRKGRLQIGADADVTVFDPATVADRATIEDPAQPSVGIEYVIVAGQVVKDRAGLRKDVRPGRPVTPQST
ncbi:amidohydrolase family protein [Rhabdothermincola sp.]|uniref:amidohydrolase family protein n=1 Tax=Rhabdothermincola sp. TaxID=2820405 RepID=UPI002FE26EEA